MEEMDGITFLEKIKKTESKAEFLLISAYGTVEDAVRAMQLGAADFLTKPFSNDELRARVTKLISGLEKTTLIERLQEENRYLQEEYSGSSINMIGNSAQMQALKKLIKKVAVEESAVLIEGESGTGKELAANAIHRLSKCKDRPFIRVNCGALNDNLLESELFGHEKGAFTGAIRQKKGRFELAENGTLFLDEIGEVSPSMQIKLLRVLQEREFERVGGEKTIKTDARIIAATNRNLIQEVENGKFREDLFYRLNVIPIHIPALRARKDDIPLLVDYIMNKLNLKRNSNKLINDVGLEILSTYSWPGNIRELENLLERMHVISEKNEIDTPLLSSHIFAAHQTNNRLEHLPLDEALYNFEKKMIMSALKETKGVKNRAAKMLGVKTSALYYKLEKFGLL